MADTYYDDLLKLGVPDEIDTAEGGFTFEDMFDEFVANSQKVWSHDRNSTVGASEAFGCIRKTWFSKRGKKFGYERDDSYEESWGAMRRGDLIENYHIVPAVEEGLRRRGMDLIMAGEGQDTIIDGCSSATLDGLIINAPRDLLEYYGIDDIEADCVVLEMKSFDPRINITEEKAIHRGQTQMQMGLIRETTEYKPQYAVVLYVNASWLDDIRPFIIEWDEDAYNVGRARNDKVFATDDPALLAAEGKFDGMCAYCPYFHSCGQISVDRVPAKRKALTKKEVSAQDNSLVQGLDSLIHEADRLKKEKKEIERAVEEANEEIRQRLIEANESRVVGSDWKVSYTTQKGRKTISKAKLEEKGLDPEDYMDEGAGFEKLTITMDKPKE